MWPSLTCCWPLHVGIITERESKVAEKWPGISCQKKLLLYKTFPPPSGEKTWLMGTSSITKRVFVSLSHLYHHINKACLFYLMKILGNKKMDNWCHKLTLLSINLCFVAWTKTPGSFWWIKCHFWWSIIHLHPNFLKTRTNKEEVTLSKNWFSCQK